MPFAQIQLDNMLILIASALSGLFVLAVWFLVGPVWDGIAHKMFASQIEEMHSLEMETDWLSRFFAIWGLLFVANFVIFGFVLNVALLLPPILFVTYKIPFWLINSMIKKRRDLIRDQLISAMIALANTARAGLPLGQGLETISAEQPQPIASFLRRIVRDARGGIPLEESIMRVKQRLKLESFSTFANAIAACLTYGSKLTDSLDEIIKSIVEAQRLERKLEADTSAGRQLLKVLGFFPFLFVLMFYFLDSKSTGLLFSTMVGQVMCDVICVLVYISVFWATRILAIEI